MLNTFLSVQFYPIHFTYLKTSFATHGLTSWLGENCTKDSWELKHYCSIISIFGSKDLVEEVKVARDFRVMIKNMFELTEHTT